MQQKRTHPMDDSKQNPNECVIFSKAVISKSNNNIITIGHRYNGDNLIAYCSIINASCNTITRKDYRDSRLSIVHYYDVIIDKDDNIYVTGISKSLDNIESNIIIIKFDEDLSMIALVSFPISPERTADTYTIEMNLPTHDIMIFASNIRDGKYSVLLLSENLDLIDSNI